MKVPPHLKSQTVLPFSSAYDPKMATIKGNADVSYTGTPLIIRFLGDDTSDGTPLMILVSRGFMTVGAPEEFVNERPPV